jgi:hypothetical protein
MRHLTVESIDLLTIVSAPDSFAPSRRSRSSLLTHRVGSTSAATDVRSSGVCPGVPRQPLAGDESSQEGPLQKLAGPSRAMGIPESAFFFPLPRLACRRALGIRQASARYSYGLRVDTHASQKTNHKYTSP